jgi:hypothetical protein
MNTLIKLATGTPWLSGGAIWALTAASAALNAWGWAMTATGLVAIVLVTLALSSEVLGVRLALLIEAAAGRAAWAKVAVASVLMLGVIGWNVFSGHRALDMVERQRARPHGEAQAARDEAQARLDRIDAALAEIPALPANVPAARLREYRDARDAELARLEPQREMAEAALAALPSIEAPPPAIPAEAKWAILALIEALKALALWAVADRRARIKPALVQLNPAAELARKRWAAAR